MGIELEAKVRVNDHEPVRQCLIQSKATQLGIVLESNHLFDRPEGSLTAEGRGLRVRSCRVLEGRDVASTMTYKGPRIEHAMKQREEIEYAVSDAKAAVALLNALGYHENISFEKQRETWQLDDCLIELDTLPHLGTFVEIEGPTEAAIRHVQTKLQLTHADLIQTSYVHLIADHCQANNLPTVGITL